MITRSLIFATLLLPLALHAGTSASYSLTPVAADAGGLPGASANYRVTFSTTPGGPGNSPNYTVPTGYAGQLSAESLTLEEPVGTLLVSGAIRDFGAVYMASSGVTKTFTLTNIGDAPITGLVISQSGAPSNDFTLSSLAGTTLAPAASITFTATFIPGAMGARTATIHIASSLTAAGSPFDVVLTGTGTSELVTTLPATAITGTTAVLNAKVNGAPPRTTVSFEYGPDLGYGFTANASPATVNGLTPGTTYHFRADGVSGGITGNGSDATFTTLRACLVKVIGSQCACNCSNVDHGL